MAESPTSDYAESQRIMREVSGGWEPSLEQPGSAGSTTLRHSIVFIVIILFMTAVVLFLGRVQLGSNPQFANFHVGFDLPVNAITAFLLFGQYVDRRRRSYLFLAAAFLFSALIGIPFLLTFPGAILPRAPFIGGSQSSIWIWHLWHILFPSIIAVSLAVHLGAKRRESTEHLKRDILVTSGAIVLLVLLVTAVATVFHDLLPVLLGPDENVHGTGFYVTGGLAALITAISFSLALRLALRGAVLHVWVSVVLLAWLADVAASLGSYGRYTVGWYFGRIDSMIAGSTLLVVFLSDINRLYHRLSHAMAELMVANTRLSDLVEEKDSLLVELRQREEHIRRMAYHDSITDLPNRRLLIEDLSEILERGVRYGHDTAVLFLDLDNFKAVNDTWGHDIGDALLREVAVRLKRCVRGGDTVARLGGDEFVVVLPEIPDVSDAMAVAEKILAVMRETINIGGHSIRITASIGIAISQMGKGLTANDLLRLADEAMYAAKKAGRDRHWVSAVT